MPISRREFVVATAASLLVAPALRAQESGLTAQQIVDRIKAGLGTPWREKTTDGFKAGDPAAVVTGVAVTAMATLDTLRRASAARRNLVITQEPTFYTPADEPGPRASDPVYLAKKTLVDERRLVVWRVGDHWSTRQPNTQEQALAAALGWTSYLSRGGDGAYVLPQATTVGAVTALVRSKLGVRGGLRAVGRSEMKVQTVALVPGGTDVPAALPRLARADLIIVGEPREWELVPYVLDTRSAGHEKALLTIGRLVSEEPGVRACAEWIRSIVKDVPVEAIAIADPYWSPLS